MYLTAKKTYAGIMKVVIVRPHQRSLFPNNNSFFFFFHLHAETTNGPTQHYVNGIGDKMAETWNCPVTSILCRCVYLHDFHIISCLIIETERTNGSNICKDGWSFFFQMKLFTTHECSFYCVVL
jgi:hypothetical protein